MLKSETTKTLFSSPDIGIPFVTDSKTITIKDNMMVFSLRPPFTLPFLGIENHCSLLFPVLARKPEALGDVINPCPVFSNFRMKQFTPAIIGVNPTSVKIKFQWPSDNRFHPVGCASKINRFFQRKLRLCLCFLPANSRESETAKESDLALRTDYILFSAAAWSFLKFWRPFGAAKISRANLVHDPLFTLS